MFRKGAQGVTATAILWQENGRRRFPPSCLGRLLDELLQRIRQFAILIGAALAQLSRYLFGHVANPTFREVKANDANRVPVLAFQQIVDDSFKIGVFNVCLAPGTTRSAEVVEDQIDVDLRITQLHATKPGI